jgi:hypothetical protein
MGEGGDVAIREERAWILQNRINPLPVCGALELRDARISFTLGADAVQAPLGWLEEQLGVDDLRATLEAGDEVVAFDYPLDACKVSWPLTGGGATMFVETSERKWVISYEQPAGGSRFSQSLPVMSGRKRAREWKLALARAYASA